MYSADERREERRKRRIELKEKNMDNNKSHYPKFVNFNGIILRRVNNTEYWCDNGHWGVSTFLDNGGPVGPVLKSRRNEHFDKNVILREATEEQWVESVGEYRPSNVKLMDGYMSFGKYIPNSTGLGNPCAEISLGESEPSTLPYSFEGETDNNKFMYLLIR